MSGLIKFDPFAELQSLQRQVFGDDWLSPIRSLQLPATDIYTENDKQLAVEAHLPNFEDKDIDISLDGNALVIRAEKHEQDKDKNKKYVVRESSSSYYRKIHLPQAADKEAIEAHMKDGVLKVIVPFKELPEPKKITINK